MIKGALVTAAAISAFACIGVALELPRHGVAKNPSDRAGSKAESRSRQGDRRRQEYESISVEVQQGDLARARSDAARFVKEYPRYPLARLLVADVDYAQGRTLDAYNGYKTVILSNLASFGPGDRLLHFADAAHSLGRDDDAATIYRRIIKGEAGLIDTDLLKPLYSPDATVEDLRAVAHAMFFGVFHPKGYIREIQLALKSAPTQPAPHFIYATVLAEFGKYRDANAELNAAAALLPADKATQFRSKAYSMFGLDRLDHGSRGVIGPHGQVTITRFAMPLPNSSRPLTEPRPQGPASPIRP